MDEKATLAEAIARYGEHLQLVVAMEEMAELTKALSKHIRGADNRKDVAEEIADVEIMLAQIKMMLDIGPDVRIFRMAKIQRLQKRLEASRE